MFLVSLVAASIVLVIKAIDTISAVILSSYMPTSLRTPSGTSPYNLPLLQGNGD